MSELARRLDQPLLRKIAGLLPTDRQVFLVGGAVRDAFLGQVSYDLDFVTGPDAMQIARKLGDGMGAAYFPLDPVRKVARLVLKPEDGDGVNKEHPIRVDFSAFQGQDLLLDLKGRDFTINAMAVDVQHLDTLIDPVNGAADLAAKRLRACSSASMEKDPVRVMRAVRFSVSLELKIVPETLTWMREATAKLPQVSTERLRDELFRILSIKHPATSLRILDNLATLEFLIPEVAQLKTVKQSPPHIWDAYNHTLEVLDRLEDILDVLRLDYDPDKAENLSMGLLVMQLGRYRKQLAEHLVSSLNLERPTRGLLFFAGLFHDTGKLDAQSIDEAGWIRFIGHEELSAKLTRKRLEELKLSNPEIDRLVTIVINHMRPSALSHTEEPPSRKAVYHFFRDTGAEGVDICLLSLADMLATYGPSIPQERWARHLKVVRTLLDAWWEEREQKIFPPQVINGNELMDELNISAGPVVGYLLESIREAQVNQEIHDKDQALELARRVLSLYNKNGLT